MVNNDACRNVQIYRRAVVESLAKQAHFHKMGYCMVGLRDIINRAAEIAGGNHNLKSYN